LTACWTAAIDAAYSIAPATIQSCKPWQQDRPLWGTPIAGNPRLRKLFADGGRQLVIEYFRKPVSFRQHTVVVQKRLLNEHPGLR
jgi:hypothetical protein